MSADRLILPRLLLACVTCVTAGCAVCGLRPPDSDATTAATCAETVCAETACAETVCAGTACAETTSASAVASAGSFGSAATPRIGSFAPRPSPYPASAAAELYRRGCRAEARGDASAVDDFYHAAMTAWVQMFGPRLDGTASRVRLDGELLRLYNDAVGRCVEAGWRFGRLDLGRGLTVRTAGGDRLIPLTAHDLPWIPARMDELCHVDAEARRRLDCTPGRAGLGAPMIATRHRDEDDPQDRFLLDVHPYALTAILRPPAGADGGRLEFHDVLRHTHVAAAGLTVPLRAEPSAAVHSAECRQRFDHNPWRNYFLPHVTRPQHRLYLLEPHQPGRIPLVLVHGFLSDPWSWREMIDALRSDPEIMRRYQIALYFYPTSVDITLPAADLRDELRELAARHDPHGEDPAMRQMVLAGFSLGGLLSKLQVTSSGERLWRAYAKVPFDQVELDDESRAFFARLFFFEPLPFVKRVVFMATPHDGVTLPARAARCIGRLLAGNLPEAERHYWEFRWKNPDAAREFLPRTFPSSVFDVTEDKTILPAIKHLPFNPCVHRHTIYGEVPCCLIGQPSDVVVPVESARTPGVESELALSAHHGQIHRDERTAAEMKTILWQHWCAATAPCGSAGPHGDEPTTTAAPTTAPAIAPAIAPAPDELPAAPQSVPMP